MSVPAVYKDVICVCVCFFSCAEGVSVTDTASIDSSTQQALQYALAGAAQQVQIHRIGEDGQVQVVSTHIRHQLEPFEPHLNIYALPFILILKQLSTHAHTSPEERMCVCGPAQCLCVSVESS